MAVLRICSLGLPAVTLEPPDLIPPSSAQSSEEPSSQIDLPQSTDKPCPACPSVSSLKGHTACVPEGMLLKSSTPSHPMDFHRTSSTLGVSTRSCADPTAGPQACPGVSSPTPSQLTPQHLWEGGQWARSP